MQTISLLDCTWNKNQRKLYTYSEIFGGGFPRVFQVNSPYTGRTVEFRPIGPKHPLFDEDGWDGELAVYESQKGDLDPIVCVISHAY